MAARLPRRRLARHLPAAALLSLLLPLSLSLESRVLESSDFEGLHRNAHSHHKRLFCASWRPSCGAARRAAQLLKALPDVLVSAESALLNYGHVMASSSGAVVRNDFGESTRSFSGTHGAASLGPLLLASSASILSIRRGRVLQELVLPPLVLLPTPPPSHAPPSLVILAPDRTHRRNPLQGLQWYTGGWDLYSADYWASVAWGSNSGVILGVLWALFGLGFVLFLGVLCLCCRTRWRRVRDGTQRFEASQVTAAGVFMGLGVLLALTGFGLMVAGAVGVKSSANGMMEFVTQQVQNVSLVVNNVTVLVRNITAPGSFLGKGIPPDTQATIDSSLDRAESAVASAANTSTSAQESVSHAVGILEDILFVVGCVVVFLMLLALFFTFRKWVVASNAMTFLLWILAFFNWVLVSVFVLGWLFGGDTTQAVSEVGESPSDLTKFNLIVPCLETAQMQQLAAATRYAGYVSILALNSTINSELSLLFELTNTPGGICNPFGPPPWYNYSSTTCADVCNPKDLTCDGDVINIATLVHAFPTFICNSSQAPSGQCIPSSQTTDKLTQQLDVLALNVENFVILLPDIKKLMDCGYIRYIAVNLAGYVNSLEYGTLLLWLGFLFISLATVVYSISAPIYIYRAVRTRGSHYGSSELVPMNTVDGALATPECQQLTSTPSGEGASSDGAQEAPQLLEHAAVHKEEESEKPKGT